MDSLKFRQYLVCLLLIATSPATLNAGDEGSAALFVVDTSPQFAATEGQCVQYTKDAQPGPNKRLLAIAKGCENSVVLIVAFDAGHDSLRAQLPPVMWKYSPTAPAARYPPASSDRVLPFEAIGKPIDLFVLMCKMDDPVAEQLRKQIENIEAAIAADQPARTLLLTSGLRSGLTKLMRTQARSIEAPIAPNAIAAVRRGLTTLHDDWKDDSLPIRFSKDKPGLMLFKIEQ